MEVIKFLLVPIIIVIVTMIIYWKVYNYFLSARDAVGLSTVQYYVNKLVGGLVLGIVFAFLYGMAITPSKDKSSGDASSKTQNSAAKQHTESSTSNTQTTNCPANINPVICNNASLSNLHNKFVAALARANSVNSSQAGGITTDFQNDMKSCGNDETCIGSAYVKGINAASSVTAESR